MDTKKQDTNIGNTVSSLILASDKPNTAGELTPARTPPAVASIRVEDLLSLFQTDLFDLAKMGIKSACMGKANRLYFVLSYDGHVLNFRDGDIYLDGINTKTA